MNTFAEGGAARRTPTAAAVVRATICPDAKKERLKGHFLRNGPAASQSRRLDRQPPKIASWTTEWVGPTHSWVAAGVFRRGRQLVPPTPFIFNASHTVTCKDIILFQNGHRQRWARPFQSANPSHNMGSDPPQSNMWLAACKMPLEGAPVQDPASSGQILN